MTSGPHSSSTRQPLRLRLKPKAPAIGHVDGSWWPRSRDLVAELPALAEVLAIRLGPIRRVAYALAGWDAAPRRVEVDGTLIRLEGFRSQDQYTVHVTGGDRRRISLLVVPPDTEQSAGHDALLTASIRGNADSPATILARSGVLLGHPLPEPRHAIDYPEHRWEVDGGHLRSPAISGTKDVS